MKVAAIQTRSGTSIVENCDRVSSLVREAAGMGARYIQTPEMTGILQRSRKDLFEEIGGEEKDPLIALAASLSAELGIWLHIGSHAIQVGEGKAANRAFVFSPRGQIVARYDKIHMFDVDLDNGERWRESGAYQPGDAARMVEIDGLKVGISICYDIRFPHLYRTFANAGAQILTAPSSFTRQTGKAHWHVLMRARAIENGAYMIAAAQGGIHEDGRETFGHSLIINPWGEILAECDGDEPGVIIADVDPGQVLKARQKVPNLANGRGFSLAPLTGDESRVSNEAAE